MNPCKSGIASFMSEQQSAYRMSNFAKALVCGGIGSGVLYVADEYLYNLNLTTLEMTIPLAFCLGGIVVKSFITTDSRNAEYIKTYNSMCSK